MKTKKKSKKKVWVWAVGAVVAALAVGGEAGRRVRNRRKNERAVAGATTA